MKKKRVLGYLHLAAFILLFLLFLDTASSQSLVVYQNLSTLIIEAGNPVSVYGNVNLTNGSDVASNRLDIFINDTLLSLDNLSYAGQSLYSTYIIDNNTEFLSGTRLKTTSTDNALKLSRSSDYNWLIRNISVKPSPRVYHSMVYDSFDKLFILFGGNTWPTGYSDETWSFNSSSDTWAQLNPSTKPTGRYKHAMAFDSYNNIVVMFGGQDNTGILGDTWVYNYTTNTWTNMNPGTSPSARVSHGMVYDSDARAVILFGGDASGYNNETWIYNYTTNTWTNMNPGTSPSPRRAFGMAYDPDEKLTILFGGEPFNNELWAYNISSNTWINRTPANSPPARSYMGFAYDEEKNFITMYGGGTEYSEFGGLKNDVWHYNVSSNTWEQKSPSSTPGARRAFSQAYDNNNYLYAIFGGASSLTSLNFNNQTWFYDNIYYSGSGYDILTIEAAAPVLFKNISWSQDLQPNTNITIQTRVSQDNSNWSPWSSALSTSQPYYLSNLSHESARYMQIMANLSTGNVQVSPLLNNITVKAIPSTDIYGNYNYSFIPPLIVGVHRIKVLANYSGMGNWSEISLSVTPNIEYAQGTQENNTYASQDWIYIVTAAAVSDFANITYRLFNTSGLVNKTIYYTETYSHNFSSLDSNEKEYWYNVTIIDNTGFEKTTETRKITLDTVYPDISLNLSSGLLDMNFQAVEINATTNETYFNNISVNITLPDNTSIVFSNSSSNLSFKYIPTMHGTYSVIAETYDLAGNLNISIARNFSTLSYTTGNLSRSLSDFNILNMTTTSNYTLIMDVNLTNTGNTTMYYPNISLVFSSSWLSNYTGNVAYCNNISSLSFCEKSFLITIPAGESIGTYTVDVYADWLNPNMTRSNISYPVPLNIFIDDNPDIRVNDTPLSKTIGHGESHAIGDIKIESTGNANTPVIKYNTSGGNLSSSWIQYSRASGSFVLASGSSKNVTISANIPKGTDPGTYITNLSVFMGDTLKQTINLSVIVPIDYSWDYYHNLHYMTVEPGMTVQLGILKLNNTANVQMEFFTSRNLSLIDKGSAFGYVNISKQDNLTRPITVTTAETQTPGFYSYKITIYTLQNTSDKRYIYGNFTLLNVPPTFNTIETSTYYPEINGNVQIRANITDLHGVSDAWVNLTLPTGQSQILDMNNNGDIYWVNYTPAVNGTFNFTVLSNDTISLLNESEVHYFYVVARTTMNASISYSPALITRITQQDSQEFNMTINITNTGHSTAYSAELNWSMPDLWNISDDSVSLGNIGSGSSTSLNFTVIVPSGTWPGSYPLTATINWTNPDDSITNNITIGYINVSSNKILNLTPFYISNISHNYVNRTLIYAYASGNDNLTNLSLGCSGQACSLFNIAINESYFNITAGINKSIELNISVPFSYPPGNFSFNLTESNYGKKIQYNFSIPINTSWRKANANFSKAVGAYSSDVLGTINISNMGNVNISLLLNSSNHSIAGISTLNLNLTRNTTSYVTINYTAPAIPSNYTINITIFNYSLEVPELVASFNLEVIDFSVNISNANTTNASGIAANETLFVFSKAYYEGQELTRNVTFEVELDGASCPVTGFSYDNESSYWKINCTAPDIADGIYYNLTLYGTFTNYSAVFPDRLSNAIYYRDVSPATFIQTIENDVVYGSNQTLIVNATDNVNISRVWVNVSYNNGNTTMYYMVESGGLYYANLTNLSLGDYDLTYYINDTSNNFAAHREWFEVYTPINFGGFVQDSSNNSVVAEFEFYRPNTTYLMLNFTTSPALGEYNFSGNEVHARKYDIKIKTEKAQIWLKNVTINSSTTDIIDLEPLSSSDVTDLPYRELIGIAVRSNISVSGNITLNYSGLDIGNENNIYVFKCPDWVFLPTTKTCNSTWSRLTGITRNISADIITAEINSFSAYMAGEYEPNPDTGSSSGGSGSSGSSSGGSGGPSGGGGGGGKIVQKIINQSFAAELIVQADAIEKELYPGENSSALISFQNSANLSINVSINASEDILPFLKYPSLVTLKPKASEKLLVNISIPNYVTPRKYVGEISITTSRNETRQIPVEITVLLKERTYKVDVHTLSSIYSPGDIMEIQVDIISVGIIKDIEADLSLFVKSLKTNQTVYEAKEFFRVDKSFVTAIKSFNISTNITQGDYIINATIYYKDNNRLHTAHSIKKVKIKRSLIAIIDKYLKKTFFNIEVWQFFIVIIGLFSLFVSFRMIEEVRFKSRKYKARVYYSRLPKKGKRSGFIGYIAETRRKAYIELDRLMTHTLVAGSTGAGKSVSAQVIIEEALLKGVSVIVFDPTAQWTGFLRKCTEKAMLSHYKEFGMDPVKDPKAFNGNIRHIDASLESIDIKKLMNPGEINVIVLNKLRTSQIDLVVTETIQEVFDANLPESKELKLLLVFDEVHRLLPKYGGSGSGFNMIERACREFRKWGVGMLLISQVLNDFVGEIKANINTEIQMKTKHEEDQKRIEKIYGIDILRSINEATTGIGLVHNSEFNKGKPYFVHFRPLRHSITRLKDDKIAEYNKYNKIIDEYEYQIEQLKALDIDVFDSELELKLALDKVKTGEFAQVRIYTESLDRNLGKIWKKLKKKPKKRAVKKISLKNKNIASKKTRALGSNKKHKNKAK